MMALTDDKMIGVEGLDVSNVGYWHDEPVELTRRVQVLNDNHVFILQAVHTSCISPRLCR
jgi:hypothetical protein